MTFVDSLVKACGRVSERYILLPVAGRDHPIKRERVYCYELYHQLRNELGDCELTLTGEPDKAGHPAFRGGPQLKPDFVFHVPGVHSQNIAAVEVECEVTLDHVKKDLRSLKAMQGRGYSELVLLLFSVSAVPWEILINAANDVGVNLAQINVVLHAAANSPAVISEPPGMKSDGARV